MANSQISNSFSTFLRFKIISKFLLVAPAFLLIFPTAKASAYASMYTSSSKLSVGYSQCKERAGKAANLILSNQKEPIEEDGKFIIVGTTAVTNASLVCIETAYGSNFIVTTSQDSWEPSEAKSVLDRVKQLVVELN